MTQILEEHYFTKGRVIAHGTTVKRGEAPPLAEQRRIVAKVGQLMTLVNRLKAHLAASRSAAANLMDAVVAELMVVDKP